MEKRNLPDDEWRVRTDSSKMSKINEIYDFLGGKASRKESIKKLFSNDFHWKWIWDLQKIYLELLSLLENKRYIDFQKKIWMKESEIDGKLWESTLRKLKLYIVGKEKLYKIKHKAVGDIIVDLYSSSYIEWTEKSSQSRLLSIRKFLSDEKLNKWSIPLIKKNLLLTLDQQRYKDFQRKIWMDESERDGKLWKKTEELMYAYFANLEESKKWTEKNPLSKLNEIKLFLSDISDEWGTKELYSLKKDLFYLLNKWDYRWFQRKIWMNWEDIDGKLWKSTLTALRLFLSPHLNYIMWTENNKDSKLLEIRTLLKNQEKLNSQPKEIKQLLKLLETKDYKAFQKMIKIKDEDIDWMLWWKTLRALSEYLMLFEKRIPWRFKLIKKDWNRWEYTYLIRKWWTPKNIRAMFSKQIQRPSSAIKILNKDWLPFLDKEWKIDENHIFWAWDKIIVKWPLEDKERFDDTLEKIAIQEEYINNETDEYKTLLKRFNREQPMKKDIELSFGIPVYKDQSIEKTLESVTTNQKGIDPSRFEVVVLLNRPNAKAEFDSTRDKVIAFKHAHPEFNICIFEHTFNFKEKYNNEWKLEWYNVIRWAFYKMLWDIITYRNTERKKIKGMDLSKIRNLIMKTWWSDSPDKNPRYIINQIEKYAKEYDWRENVRMIGDSRIPADVAINFPLIEICEFLQRKFDNTYTGGPLNRDIGIWTYKSRLYAASKWFKKTAAAKEDMDYIVRMKKYVHEHNDICMHDDSWFVGAVDNSSDRGIFSMICGKAYCDRKYEDNEEDQLKSTERNSWAVSHVNSPETNYLKLTKENVEKNIWAYYESKINRIFTNKSSEKYKKYLASKEWKKATIREKFQFIKNNIVDPIMQKVLADSDLTWLEPDDYILECEYDKKERKNRAKCRIILKNWALDKIKRNHQKKIEKGYYDYWK